MKKKKKEEEEEEEEEQRERERGGASVHQITENTSQEKWVYLSKNSKQQKFPAVSVLVALIIIPDVDFDL